MSEYRPVPAQVDLPALEHEVLALWRDKKTFDRSLDRAGDRPRWTFFEGPPTANGRPGTHHVEARVFKDVFPRFKTMQGFMVERKAGWDCHGLPVELAVEKELGFSGKADIEAFGIERVQREMSRVGAAARRRLRGDDRADGVLGRHLRPLPHHGCRLHRVGVVGLEADPREGPARRGLPGGAVLPARRDRALRPRGGAGLRDGHRPERLRALPADVRPVRRRAGVRGLAAGLDDDAVDAGVQHRSRGARRRRPTWWRPTATETLVVAEPLFDSVLGEGWTVRGPRARRRHGAVDLPAAVRARRSSPRSARATPHRTSWCSPTTSPPRTAPAWCTSPPRSARTTCRCAGPTGCRSSYRCDRTGTSTTTSPLVGGQFFKHADADLVDDLERAWPAVPARAFEHSYPHCWRCHTALMYYAQPSWYVRTTAVKDALLRENEKTNWFPDTIKWGRYGDWLTQQRRLGALAQPLLGYAAADLALRRGTPDVRRLARRALGADRRGPVRARPAPSLRRRRRHCPARPAAETARRVPEVIDAWFDSGSMPFAQWGYPHAPGSAREFEPGLPRRLHLRGDRPDTWLVLHADGHRHRGLRRVVVQERAGAWGTSSPRTAARCPSTSATSSSRCR